MLLYCIRTKTFSNALMSSKLDSTYFINNSEKNYFYVNNIIKYTLYIITNIQNSNFR